MPQIRDRRIHNPPMTRGEWNKICTAYWVRLSEKLPKTDNARYKRLMSTLSQWDAHYKEESKIAKL